MQVGTAWADITPEGQIHVAGQLHARIGEYTHDPLTVNAAAFDEGGLRAVVVSCDLLFLPDAYVESVKAACEQSHGIPAASVIIACTHTHVAPCTAAGLPGQVDQAYMASLHERLVGVVGRALDDLEDAQVYAGTGWVDELGYNRRGLHTDGRVDMYHGCWNDDFAGLEGPRDGAVPVVFARRMDGSMKLVIPSFAMHPTTMESACFYSADVVGAVRAFLRRNLGGDVGVVYLTGAAGNTAPWDIEHDRDRVRHWYGEEGCLRAGMYLGSEILKVIASASVPMADPVLALAQAMVDIPVRPYPSDFDPNMTFGPEYFRASQKDWPRLREESPVPVRLNVLRVGDAAICASPGELYVEHGLAIKSDSPARVTVVAELADGYAGYVPTKEAFAHGGYSVWPADTSKLAEDAGDTIVLTTRSLLHEAFSK